MLAVEVGPWSALEEGSSTGNPLPSLPDWVAAHIRVPPHWAENPGNPSPCCTG